MADKTAMAMQGWTGLVLRLDEVEIPIPDQHKYLSVVLRGSASNINNYIATHFTQNVGVDIHPTTSEDIANLVGEKVVVIWTGCRDVGTDNVWNECRYWADDNFPMSELDGMMQVAIDVDRLIEDQEDLTIIQAFLQHSSQQAELDLQAHIALQAELDAAAEETPPE